MADGRCSSHGRRSHFLVVAYGYQGHLNPARALARRLARVHGAAARVTLSVTVSAHARMFPSSSDGEVEDEVSDGLISYVPYSDGFGFGFAARPRSADERARCRRESVTSLSAVVRRLAVAGRPVTCVVSAFFLPAADVAVEHGIPLAVFWSQSATTLAAYYHYFHGYEQLVAAHVDDPTYEVRLPGLPPLQIRNLPSFLVDATGSEHSKASVEWMRTLLELIAREKPKVLVNTTDITEEEATALQAMKQHLDVFAVGPMVTPSPATTNGCSRGDDRIIHLYEQDQKKGMYIKEWLDAQRDRSVVYISFGSMLGYDNRQQVEEILQGLCECGRPYLWVVPKDGRGEEVERCLLDDDGNSGREAAGMVVEWCEQLEVLSHSSTGCFVTHCGWNSTLEAILLGVPMVTVPNWSDQAVNAHLVEEWGVGIRAKRDAATGLLVGTELANCIEVVIGDGDEAVKMRERAEALKDKLRKEVIESDLVEFSLQNFMSAMQKQT